MVYRSEEFPEGVSSERVVQRARLKPRHQHAVPSRPHLAMVLINSVGERFRLPPLHSCGDHCNMIHTASPRRHIAANLLQALPPKQLAHAGDVLVAYEAIVVMQ